MDLPLRDFDHVRCSDNVEQYFGRSYDVAMDETCLVRLILRDVQAALRRLPASQREAVLFVGVEGNSYETVAHEMGISVAAVRCHLARARARLRAVVIDAEAASPCSKQTSQRRAVKALPAG